MERIALVTGASTGIGEASARALAADGWKVICAARSTEAIEKIAQEIGGEAITLDVTDQESVDKLAEKIPHLDLLVNNAGGAKGLDPIKDAILEDWQWMYEVNVLGLVRLTKALLPKLIAADGLIINMSSIAGHEPYAGGAGYNAAKHAVAALTRVLRIETHEQPLRVTELCPGRVKTDFSLKRFKGDAAKAEAVYADKLNLTAEDVAETVRWVASLPTHVNIERLTLKPRDQV
ncbi:MAG: SDR family NAD(P)-dependent oxidoreductase [Corynebacterium sp.]|nr:SDR family NAD(P)-dependent oxidoreductase [Corynebacterium sp.]